MRKPNVNLRIFIIIAVSVSFIAIVAIGLGWHPFSIQSFSKDHLFSILPNSLMSFATLLVFLILQ